MNILNSGRFGIGAGASGGLRRLIGNLQCLATDWKIQILCILFGFSKAQIAHFNHP